MRHPPGLDATAAWDPDWAPSSSLEVSCVELCVPQVKQYRKEIADLLRSGKQDYARIRVEAILRENAAMQVHGWRECLERKGWKAHCLFVVL